VRSTDYGKSKSTGRERLLDLLSDCGWHPCSQLLEHGGVRYSARVLELKRLGVCDREPGVRGSIWQGVALTHVGAQRPPTQASQSVP